MQTFLCEYYPDDVEHCRKRQPAAMSVLLEFSPISIYDIWVYENYFTWLVDRIIARFSRANFTMWNIVRPVVLIVGRLVVRPCQTRRCCWEFLMIRLEKPGVWWWGSRYKNQSQTGPVHPLSTINNIALHNLELPWNLWDTYCEEFISHLDI